MVMEDIFETFREQRTHVGGSFSDYLTPAKTSDSQGQGV